MKLQVNYADFHLKYLLKNKREGFEVDFVAVWSKIKVKKERNYTMYNPKYEKLKNYPSVFSVYFRDSYSIFKKHWLSFHCQGDYPECIKNSA